MLTFREHAAHVMARRAEDGIRGLTSERNRMTMHIAPSSFYDKPLDEIRGPEIRQWVRDMAKKKARDTRGDRTLSRGTIARSFALVSAVFADAVRDEIIATNPCTGVELPKRATEATKQKWSFLSLEEQQAFATCPELDEATRLTIQFAFYTGLRQGEQFHLLLEDLHIDGDHPHVYVRFGSKNAPPKSGKTREVPLVPQAVIVARRWLEVLPTFAPSNQEGLAFPTAVGTRRGVGKPLARVRVGGKYVDGWTAAKLAVGITRRLRWHDLRHSCASSLIAGWWGRRWSTEEVREVLGHSSITMTERYAHLGANTIREAARATVAPAPVVDVAEPPRGLLMPLRRFGRLVAERIAQLARRGEEQRRGA